MPISQAEFARRRNVSRACVTQWIKGGKIDGAAIVPGGLDEAIAIEQLRERLDSDHRFANGLGTNLQLSEPATVTPPATPPPIAAAVVSGSLEQQLLKERLDKAQRENRAAALQEAIDAGLVCDVATARAQTTREINQAIIRIEGLLPGIASSIASRFGLPERDVLHLLRSEWQKTRQAAAIEARERAEPMQETVGFDLGEA